jgi:hypothetical protein
MAFGFEFSKDDLKKSQKCPAGMHVATLVEVEDEYMNDKGNTVQKCSFETLAGYFIPVWFNAKMPGPVFELVAAAEGITITEENMPSKIVLKDYIGKKVALSVSHAKDKNNKIQAQVDNFFNADKVPMF